MVAAAHGGQANWKGARGNIRSLPIDIDLAGMQTASGLRRPRCSWRDRSNSTQNRSPPLTTAVASGVAVQIDVISI